MAVRETQLITSGEAAKIRNCSPENIRRLVRIGRLPVAAVVGRGQMLFDRTIVEQLEPTRSHTEAA
jgi:excisionase family DNA binding protein